MKARKLISASAVALMALTFALPATAAEVDHTTTNGDVTFTGAAGDTEGGNPTTPKDDNDGEDIVPDDKESSHTDGPLRIEHVPTLHFGSQVVSTKDMSYNSLWNKGTVGGGTTSTNIPVFAQVRDETATQTNKWTLSVAQTTPFTSTTVGTPPLTNTRVHIHAATDYNSLRGTTGAKATTTAVAINPATGYTEIPYGTAGVVIMTGENTNGSDSSVVFSDTAQYDPSAGDYNVKEPANGSGNAGLQLFVPGTDVAYAEMYQATFTWTLDDTL